MLYIVTVVLKEQCTIFLFGATVSFVLFHLTLFYLVYITVLYCILATSMLLSSTSPFLSIYLSSTFFLWQFNYLSRKISSKSETKQGHFFSGCNLGAIKTAFYTWACKLLVLFFCTRGLVLVILALLWGSAGFEE